MRLFMVNTSESDVLASVRAFQAIDKDNSGQLDEQEMIEAVTALKEEVANLDFGTEDVKRTFRMLDIEKEGLITYT